MRILEVASFEKEVEIIMNKLKLMEVRSERTYINNALTVNQREQSKILETAERMNKNVKIDHQKLINDEKKCMWNKCARNFKKPTRTYDITAEQTTRKLATRNIKRINGKEKLICEFNETKLSVLKISATKKEIRRSGDGGWTSIDI